MPKPTFFNLPDDKRQKILDLAIAEFAENDYEVASISKIVAQAGIAKGSFYQYFEDKKDLYLYLMDEGARMKMEFLRDHTPPDPNMDLFAYLRWLYKTGLLVEFDHPELTKVAQRALYGKGPLPEAWAKQVREQSITFFRNLIVMGIANGQLRATLDPDVAAYFCYTLSRDLSQYMMERLGLEVGNDNLIEGLRQNEARAEAIFDQFVAMLEHAMR